MVAPDLIGHGLAPASTDYSLQTFTDALRPLLAGTPPFELVIAHSLGALVALSLFKDVKDTLRLVLVDPPLEQASGAVEVIKRLAINEVSTVQSVEYYIVEKGLSERDAVLAVLGKNLCKPSVIEDVFKVRSCSFGKCCDINSD